MLSIAGSRAIVSRRSSIRGQSRALATLIVMIVAFVAILGRSCGTV